jgi:hypothetical protein
LLAELAAEQVGAQQTNLPSLRKAILRKLVGKPNAGPGKGDVVARPSPVAPQPPLAMRPMPATSLDEFCHEVVRQAKTCAEGWPGNRRAYIATVWQRISTAQQGWGLTQETFKNRLVEAHKAGRLTLAYADLRSKDTIDLVQASAVSDRNNEWHFVRVED